MRLRNLESIFLKQRSTVVSVVFSLFALLGVACDWNQFGNGPLNPHNSRFAGPSAGLSFQQDLMHPFGGFDHGVQVGVTSDKHGSMYVTSDDRFVSAYTPFGTVGGFINLGTPGPTAVPYILSRPLDRSQSMIFTGAEGGGFYAIHVDKSAFFAYTLTMLDADMTFGPSEVSPKRASDGTFYIVDKTGEVRRYLFAAGTLNLMGSYSLAENVIGAIALYDVDPQYPGEEVLVATAHGNLHVLDHTLTNILWTNADGVPTSDLYMGGVTVAERGTHAPVAVLPIAHAGPAALSPNSGTVRAVNLQTQATEWHIVPSVTLPGTHTVDGSVAILFEQMVPMVDPDQNPGGNGSGSIDLGGATIDPGGVVVVGGGDIGSVTVVAPGSSTVTTGGDNVIEIDPGSTTTTALMPAYHATFASSDTFIYGIDLVTGTEIWRTQLKSPAHDAPVVDRDNIIYVGDSLATLYGIEGKAPLHGTMLWVDSGLTIAGTNVVKLGIHGRKGLIVGAGLRAYRLR